GPDFGGVAHRDDCDALPAALQAVVYWRFDWFRAAYNPAREVGECHMHQSFVVCVLLSWEQ
ncbi:hypothetical protein EJ02DRAFT_357981, partial [Clathrospora elynae]